MNGNDRAAVAAFPELQRLIDLRDAPWTWLPGIRDGDLVEVHGVLAWQGGWADAIRIRYTTDATALLPHVEQTTLCRYERGENKPPLTTIVALARAYDVDPTELLLRVAAMTRRSSGARAVHIPPEWQLLAAVVQHDEASSAKASRNGAR